MRDLPSLVSFLSETRSLVMRAKTLRPARAWTERTAGLATRPVPTRALDMVRAIFLGGWRVRNMTRWARQERS